MAPSISQCPKIVCAYSSTSEQEKSYTASTKVLGSSQKSGPIIRPEIRAFSGIARYLEIFDLLYKFNVQILEDPSLSENDYDLNRIMFLLEELRAARRRVDMEDLECLSSFYQINPFFRGSLNSEPSSK